MGNKPVQEIGWCCVPPVTLGIVAVFLHFTNTNLVVFKIFNTLPGRMLWANLTELGDGLILGVILFPFLKKKKQILVAYLIGIVVNTIVVQGLKSFFAFPRPAGVLAPESIRIIGPLLTSRAFPSGHSATIFLVAGIVSYVFKDVRIRLGVLLLAISVGFSRLAVGAHWPLDVLTGGSIGWVIGWGTAWIVQKKQWVPYSRKGDWVLGSVYGLAGAISLFFYPLQYPGGWIVHYGIAAIAWGWGMFFLFREA